MCFDHRQSAGRWFPIGAAGDRGPRRRDTVGTHGTTYGGNPLAGAVAGELLSIVNPGSALRRQTAPPVVCERLQAINARYGLFKGDPRLGLRCSACVLSDTWAGKAKTLQ